MTTKPKHPNYGGKREGAGRPKEPLSVRQAKEFEATAIKLAKKYGQTLSERVGEIAWNPESSNRDVCMASNLFWKYSVIVGSEGGEADKIVGPAIFLPEEHPRLEVIDGGKDDDDESA